MIFTRDSERTYIKILHIVCYCVIVFFLLFVVSQKIRMVVMYSAPKELREMNTVAFAYQFAHGNNLYSVDTLKSKIPAATNIYGLLVPLLMGPFIRLLSFTALSALQICELLTLLVESIGAIPFYKLIRRKTLNPLLAIVGTLLFYSCYWRYSANAGAFPDQWGVSLSMVLMDLLHSDEQKFRYHPTMYAVCLTCLFYIKSYFILCAVGLIVYLLVHSAKDLVKFLMSGTFIGCISLLLVYKVFPLYFSEIFPIAQGQTLTGSPDYSYMQIAKLSVYYGPVVLLAITGIFITLYYMMKKTDFRDLITYELCQIIFILPALFQIAENQGTNYTYYLQLWYPYIISYGICSIPSITNLFESRCSTINIAVLRVAASFLLHILLIVSIIKVQPSFQCRLLTKDQQQAWDTAYNILDQYSSDGEILVSMLLSEYCLKNNIETSNYGQAEYNNFHNLENYQNNKIWRNLFLFQYTDRLLQKNISYNKTVKENVYAQNYSCIALVYAGEYHLFEEDLLNAGYKIIATQELSAGDQSWHTVFYSPAD